MLTQVFWSPPLTIVSTTVTFLTRNSSKRSQGPFSESDLPRSMTEHERLMGRGSAPGRPSSIFVVVVSIAWCIA